MPPILPPLAGGPPTALPAAPPTYVGGNPHGYGYPPHQPHPHPPNPYPVATAQPTPALLVAGQQVYHPPALGGTVPPPLHHPQPQPMVSMKHEIFCWLALIVTEEIQ